MTLRAQLDVLVDRGYPELAGMTEDAFRALAEPLAPLVPEKPYVLVAPMVAAHLAIERVSLEGRAGFTTMEPDDVARFVPTTDVEVPAGLYLLVDPDTGADTRGVRPDDALPILRERGRTPLTLEEGIAVVTQHPEWLRERNAFEMLGSRCGDKRVTGVWVSERRPRLGWCWGGNPHTWLGMASAAARVAA